MTAACHYINTAMKDMKRIFLFFSFWNGRAPVIQFLDVIWVGGGGAGVEMALFCFNK